MRVLIVEDNPSVTAILTEILNINGHDVQSSLDWEGVKDLLKENTFDIMFLDSIVNLKSTIPLIEELDLGDEMKIVLILNGKEQLPRDSPLIVRSIRKPFNSSEVLDAVKFVEDGCINKPSAPVDDKKPKWFRFFMPSRDGKGLMEKRVSTNPITRGKSYVVYESEPDKIYDLVNRYGDVGDFLIITWGRRKAVESKVSLDDAEYIILSNLTKGEYVDITSLGTLMSKIMAHISHSHLPVIVIDNLGKIIDSNGLNSVLSFIYQIYRGVDNPDVMKGYERGPAIGGLTGESSPDPVGGNTNQQSNNIKKTVSLAVSVDPTMLTVKDKNLLEKYMEVYVPSNEESKGDKTNDRQD